MGGRRWGKETTLSSLHHHNLVGVRVLGHSGRVCGIEPPHLFLLLLALVERSLTLAVLLLLLDVCVLQHLLRGQFIAGVVDALRLGYMRGVRVVHRLKGRRDICGAASHGCWARHTVRETGSPRRRWDPMSERVSTSRVFHHRGQDDRILNGAPGVDAEIHAKLVLCMAVPTDITAVVLTIIVLIVVVVGGSAYDDLEFARNDHSKAITPDGFFDAGDTCALTPLIELAAESVGFDLEHAELTGGKEAVSAGGVDMCDGGVDDGGFRRAADLGEVGEEGCEVLSGYMRVRWKLGNTGEKHTRKRPFRVSRRWRSTALWVARRSAVLARRLALRLGWVGCCSAAGEVREEVGVRGEGRVAVLVAVDLGSLLSGFSAEGADGMVSGRVMMAIVAKVGLRRRSRLLNG